MSLVASAFAVLLAAALVWAGVAKLAARRATARSFRQLGVPAPGLAAVGVPVVELGVAAALVVRPVVGGVAAALLLLGFSGFLAARLAAGVQAGCGCFGAGTHERVGWTLLGRNGLLLGAAWLAVAAPTPLMLTLEALLLAGTAAVLGAVVLGLARLREDTGRLWDNRLEPGPDGGV